MVSRRSLSLNSISVATLPNNSQAKTTTTNITPPPPSHHEPLISSRNIPAIHTVASQAPPPLPGTTRTHVNALDGLVTVNSLFTVAVFVGLSLTSEPNSTDANPECYPNYDVQKNLFIFEILSFSFFLFSSLVAQGLKIALSLRNSRLTDEIYIAEINGRILRFGMLGSAIGSMCGCFFLVMSIMDVIQIRLGYFTCGSSTAIWTFVLMAVLIFTSLCLYMWTVVCTMLQPLAVYDGSSGAGIETAPPRYIWIQVQSTGH